MPNPVFVVCLVAIACCGLTILRLLAFAREEAIRKSRMSALADERRQGERQPEGKIPEVR